MQNAKLWGKNYKFLVAVDIIDERRETRDERRETRATDPTGFQPPPLT